MDKYMHDLDSIQDIVFVNTVGGGGDESIVNTGVGGREYIW